MNIRVAHSLTVDLLMDIVYWFPSGSWMARRRQQDDVFTSGHMAKPQQKLESIGCLGSELSH